jgi:DNA-3-methyladenine glycosylase I
MSVERCAWVGNDPLMIAYHDTEWGVPVHDDRKLFEYLVLDAFQAGLSWRIILNKRAGFDAAFEHFEPAKVAQFGPPDIDRLMSDTSIVRNRRKIEATIANALLVIKIQKDYGSLGAFLWGPSNGQAISCGYETSNLVPTTTKASDEMSKRLKDYGFKFFGPTVCYAFMQGAGFVNDHLRSCFRYSELAEANRRR